MRNLMMQVEVMPKVHRMLKLMLNRMLTLTLLVMMNHMLKLMLNRILTRSLKLLVIMKLLAGDLAMEVQDVEDTR